MVRYIRRVYILAIAMTLMLCMHSTAHARSVALGHEGAYNITPHLKLLEGGGEVEYALEDYRAGLGSTTNADMVSLPHSDTGYWLVFGVKNSNPLVSNWVLDLGQSHSGTQGIANKVELYSAENINHPIVSDGRHVHNKIHRPGQKKNSVPLKIKPNETKTYLLYIEPIKGLPFIFRPSIETHEYNSTKPHLQEHNDKVALAAALIVLFLLTMLTKTHKGPIPFILFIYTIAGFTIHAISDEIIPHGNNTGAVYIDVLYSILAACGIILTGKVLAQSKNQDNIAIASILNTVAYILVILSVLGTFGISVNNFTAYVNVKVLPILTSIVIVLVTLSASRRKNLPYQEVYVIAWVTFLAAVLTRDISAYAEHYIPLLLIHLACLYVSSLASIAALTKIKSRRSEEEAMKAHAQLEAMKTREAANQDQLIRIMQREKDLLVDLKKREAERVKAMNEAKEMADKANKTKSDFLAIISHEIRTPMTGIMGTVSLLKDTKLDGTQQDYVSTLHKAGTALLDLLNDILDLSKAESGRMDIEITDFSIKEVLDNVVAIMESHAKDKKLELIADLDPKTPMFLKGDPSRLRQILSNLVNNSIKFTSQGSVTINIWPLGKNKEGKHEIYFSVTDTGIGIPKEVQKKIFTPYTQADTSTSRKFGGTGLGLSICQQLVTAMGGTIDVRSNENKGTTFFFTIPFAEGEEVEEVQATQFTPAESDYIYEQKGSAPPPPPPAPMKAEATTPTTDTAPAAGAKANILVVDDNTMNQKVVSALLQKYHVQATTVGSARDALDAIQKNSFDMVFMDMEMPEIDGLAATGMIRQLSDKEKARVPVIALTANNDRASISRCIQAGMNDYLSKPIDTAKLEKLIGNILGTEDKVQNQLGTALPENQNKEEKTEKPKPKIKGIYDKLEIDGSSDLLNKNTFDSIRMTIPRAGFIEMIQDLYTSVDELFEELEKQVIKEKHKKIAASAHSISGVCANFGFKAVSEEARRMQMLAKNKAPKAELVECLRKLKVFYQKTQNDVQRTISV